MLSDNEARALLAGLDELVSDAEQELEHARGMVDQSVLDLVADRDVRFGEFIRGLGVMPARDVQ